MIKFPFAWWDPFGIKRRHMYKFRRYLFRLVRRTFGELLTDEYMHFTWESYSFYTDYDDILEKFYRCEIVKLPILEIYPSMITDHQLDILSHNVLVILKRELKSNPYYEPDWINETYAIQSEDYGDKYVFQIVCKIIEEDHHETD